MNKNTELIEALKETIKTKEENLELLKNIKFYLWLEIDEKKDEVFKNEEEILYIERYIECYNDFKRIFHKLDVVNLIFGLMLIIPILGALATRTAWSAELIVVIKIMLAFNILDPFLRHKFEYFNYWTMNINKVNPFSFNKKRYKKELEKKEKILKTKDKSLEEIAVLKNKAIETGKIISKTAEELKTDKISLNELTQEQETRNQTIRKHFIEKVSKVLGNIPDFQSDFIKEMSEKGFNTEGVTAEDLLTTENLTLKLENRRGF